MVYTQGGESTGAESLLQDAEAIVESRLYWIALVAGSTLRWQRIVGKQQGTLQATCWGSWTIINSEIPVMRVVYTQGL